MERNTKTWIPGGVDQVDEIMHNQYIPLGTGEWKAARGAGPDPTWHSAWMSSSAPFVYIGSGHSGVLHDKALLKGLIIRISGDRVPRRCPTATVYRRYHLLHSRLRVGGLHPMHHDRNFLQFLLSPCEQSQIHVRGIRVINGRDESLCGH